jgi:ligand-binding sensor protein
MQTNNQVVEHNTSIPFCTATNKNNAQTTRCICADDKKTKLRKMNTGKTKKYWCEKSK